MISAALFVVAMFLAILAGAACTVLGAWLWHRAQSGHGPFPSLPASPPKEDEQAQPPPKAHL